MVQGQVLAIDDRCRLRPVGVVVHHTIGQGEGGITSIDGCALPGRVVLEDAVLHDNLRIAEHQHTCAILHGSLARRVTVYYMETVKHHIGSIFHCNAMIETILNDFAFMVTINHGTIE